MNQAADCQSEDERGLIELGQRECFENAVTALLNADIVAEHTLSVSGKMGRGPAASTPADRRKPDSVHAGRIKKIEGENMMDNEEFNAQANALLGEWAAADGVPLLEWTAYYPEQVAVARAEIKARDFRKKYPLKLEASIVEPPMRRAP